jgi:hypothetical protein
VTAPPELFSLVRLSSNFVPVPGCPRICRFFFWRTGQLRSLLSQSAADLLCPMQYREFRLICLSRPLSDLSAAPLPKSQGPGVSISLFGNSSRLNPLTLAGSATYALLRAPIHSAQVMNRAEPCWLTNVQPSADAYLVSNFS